MNQNAFIANAGVCDEEPVYPIQVCQLPPSSSLAHRPGMDLRGCHNWQTSEGNCSPIIHQQGTGILTRRTNRCSSIPVMMVGYKPPCDCTRITTSNHSSSPQPFVRTHSYVYCAACGSIIWKPVGTVSMAPGVVLQARLGSAGTEKALHYSSRETNARVGDTAHRHPRSGTWRGHS